MRWPFSLLFRGDRDTPAAADAVAAGAVAPGTADPARASGVPSRPAAWRSLPPVQRSIGDAPLTAPALPFGRELAGLRPPDPILRPLMHALAADGPAGLVSGIATPLAARAAPAAAPADHPALPALRGVQRRARTVTDARLPAREVDGSAADAMPPSAAGAATVVDAGDGAAELPASRPARVLPVVVPSATAPALAATRVGPSTAPAIARAVAPALGAGTATAAGSPVQRNAARPTSPTATPPVAPSMVAPSTGSAPAPDAGGATPGPESPAARPAQARSLGESRRLGLGAPLAARPSVQRAATGPDLPLARAGRSATPPGSPVAATPPPRRAAAAEATLPVLRVASEGERPATPPEPGAPGAGGPGADAPPATPAATGVNRGFADAATWPVQRSGERPLVGDAGRPASPPPGDGADTGPADTGPAGAEPGVRLALAGGMGIDGAVAAPGGAPAADPAAGPRPAAPSAAAPATPAAPTSPAARSAPLVVARSLRGAAPLRPPVGVPVVPSPTAAGRTGGPTGATGIPAGPAPGSSLPAGTSEAAQTPGGSGPVGAGSGRRVAQRSSVEGGGSRPGPGGLAGRAPLPVARAVSAPGSSRPGAGRASEPVAVSRLADGGGSAPPPPGRVLGWSAGSGFGALPASDAAVVQRAVTIDEMATEVDASPAAGAAQGGTGGAGAESGGQDYEEIADHVYDRIRSRFATELLLDRERMGLLIDG